MSEHPQYPELIVGALALRLTYTTRRLVEYYAEVGPDGPVRYLPDDVLVGNGARVG